MGKLGCIFFVAWLVACCSIDSIFDDWRACVVAVVALIVAIVCAATLGGERDD